MNMMTTIVPDLMVLNNTVRADSRHVAETFGKRHDNVLRDIENLIAQEPDLGLLNFEETPYQLEQNGQTYRCYTMDRDGFTLLAMGFTGSKALKWKLAYIGAFNKMEAALREQPSSSMPALNDPSALREMLLLYVEKVIDLEAENAFTKPKAIALDHIAETKGSFSITDAAQILKMRRGDLYLFLQERRWGYRRGNRGRLIAYQDRVVEGLMETKVCRGKRDDGSPYLYEQARITAKGLAALALPIAEEQFMIETRPAPKELQIGDMRPTLVFESDKSAEIRRVIAAGTYRKHVQSPAWVGLAVAEVMGLDVKRERHRISAIISRMLGTRLLRVEKRRDEGRRMREFVVVA